MQASMLLNRRACGVAPFGSRPVVAPRRAVVNSRQPLQIAASAVAQPATLPYKAVDGADKGKQSMALKVAGETGKGLVHRYLVMVQQNARRGTASTLTRSEVRGGGKKPYAQKGSGNARRGSKRSPLFPGGGILFGPKPRDWSIKMNVKERRLALATAIQSAAADAIVVESLEGKLPEKKTKALVAALEKVGVPADKKCLLIVSKPYEHIMLAGRNVPHLAINTADAIRVFDVLNADKIVIEDAALQHIQSFYGGASSA